MIVKRILVTPSHEIVNRSHLYIIQLAEKLRNNFEHNFPGIHEEGKSGTASSSCKRLCKMVLRYPKRTSLFVSFITSR